MYRHIRILLFLLLVFLQASITSADAQPTLDTSSPRATMQSFLDSVDAYMELSLEASVSYAESDRLYQNEREELLNAQAERYFVVGIEALDLSELPSGFRRALAIESLVRMADVIARIDVPALSVVPDHAAMEAEGRTRWRIPDTRIEIALVTEGPRAGEYLFSAQTVANLKDIHPRVVDVPPKPGRVKQFIDGLAPFTSDATLYDLWRNSAATFGVLPERWSFEMPQWLKAHFLGATVWQWISVLICELVGISLIWLSWRISGKLGASRAFQLLTTALFVLAYSALATTALEALQIGGVLLYAVGLASVIFLYLSAIWTAFAGANAIAEVIIKRQMLRPGGVDSQLIRLGARLIALAVTTVLIIRGTGELGFPAYSLLTGLGVSGLAIALAARDTLSNLLGSIAIMFEKPFRSNDWIKVGEAEGTVERVGFRSTRIRTFEDSVVSIPNNLVVNTMVDNLGARGRRHQEFKLELPYETPLDSVRSFLDGVRTLVAEHPLTSGEDHLVHLNALGEEGMGVLVDFHFRVPSFDVELKQREEVLFSILCLADKLKIKISSTT